MTLESNELELALKRYRLPAGTKVLVVDDVPDIQMVFKYVLEQSNAEVIVAEDGASAIELTKIEVPDLILMDMRLPDMDGFVATQQIRQSGYVGPIIAITARNGDRDECLRAGCVDYLSKPVDSEVLLRTVNKHVVGTA